MSYATQGNYQVWDGMIVGYRIVKPDGRTRCDNIMTKVGKWIGSKCDVSGCNCHIIWHAAELAEVRQYWQPMFRAVRVLIKPEDLIQTGQARKAFVQAMSAPLLRWPSEDIVWPMLLVPGENKKWLRLPEVKEALPLQLPAPSTQYVPAVLPLSSPTWTWATVTTTATHDATSAFPYYVSGGSGYGTDHNRSLNNHSSISLTDVTNDNLSNLALSIRKALP